MTELVPTGSPFDAIRRTDADGEHWAGRELMPLLGYSKWQRFEEAIQRAIQAVQNSGSDPSRHFTGSDNINDLGYRARDYRLTRYGAYMTALNGDPRKPEIAQAQTYFAVKTREAETGASSTQLAPRLPSARELAQLVIQEADRADAAEALATERGKQLETAAPKAAYVDTFVHGDQDATILRVLAKQLGLGEMKLRQYLIANEVIYRRVVGTRWSNSKCKPVTEYEWLACSGRESWFVSRDQPEAPRLHNGQIRTTLYVTPVGKVRIAELLKRKPLAELKAGA